VGNLSCQQNCQRRPQAIPASCGQARAAAIMEKAIITGQPML
jgi:hypothetical protein